ncbi:MAG: DUF2490 domain-containing protein [Chitinophagaceae bacterium]|nr:DUF2490 domain-containing protein [Chitinophagaceae bacterium]
MKYSYLTGPVLFLFATASVAAQNNRLADRNTIGWYNNFATFKLNNRWSIHAEYQWRRADFITQWQQGLLRTGINFRLNPRVLFRVGYAWAETYAYGDIPINGLGRSFTEHRFYEMVQLNHKEGKTDFSHRFMLEQRLVGRYSSAAVAKEDEYPLLHRMRYMFRLQTPLKGKEMKDRTPYFALYDEVMIGFGKNVNANVFDQNRIGLLLGYQFNNKVRIEAGYLNQTVQFGRLVNGKNVFQYNNGLIINAIYNL